MGVIETALILLVLATAIVAIAPRFKLPMEVLLLLGSLCISLIPGLPHIALDPEIVFVVFLPPILFAAAYFTSWRDFKANKRPISLLAVGLVIFTAAAVAWIMKLLIPDMPWALGFVLGAMVAPPDASAATAITRKLGVPRRLITIIEGESLVNDATALVAYKFAVAAVMTGVFSLPLALAKFTTAALGGVAIGLAVGAAGIWLYPKLKETAAQILFSFLTAFAAYIAGEALHVSSVISTVTAGLVFGRWLPATASAELRLEAKAGWDLLLFIINALVFTLIGFQLPLVLRNLRAEAGIPQLIEYAVVVSVVVVAVRFLWVFPAVYVPRWFIPSINRKEPAPPWTIPATLSWTAMRGIVTLAAALALPLTLPSGAPFPHRDLLIFLAYTVILVTLILPSVTLPFLLPRLGLKSGDEHHREETGARIAAVRAVLSAVDRLKEHPGISQAHLDQVISRYERRLQVLEANLMDAAYSPLFDEDSQRRRLLNEILRREREAILQQRDAGLIHNEVFHQLLRELDLDDMRLHSQRL